jgi:DNA polymerase III delta subunit
MIYILAGTDRAKRSVAYAKIVSDREVMSVSSAAVSRESLLGYAGMTSLFGETPAIVIDTFVKENKTLLSADLLLQLKNSPTLFIFLEDALLASDEKKYEKYAAISRFEAKKPAQAPKINIFAIADAYGKRDKIAAWVLYCQAIDRGTEPEAISGIIFWKIKTMIQNGAKAFDPEDLKQQSGRLVSLYHKAHRGECDFTVGLEQFILSNLSV